MCDDGKKHNERQPKPENSEKQVESEKVELDSTSTLRQDIQSFKESVEMELAINGRVDNRLRNLNVQFSTLEKDLIDLVGKRLSSYKKIGIWLLGFIGLGGIITIWNLYTSIVDKTTNYLGERIEKQFQTNTIESKIDKFAKKYVEKDAKKLIISNVNLITDEIKKETNQRLSSLNKRITELEKLLNNNKEASKRLTIFLNDMTRVNQLALSARLGSLGAYKKLRNFKTLGINPDLEMLVSSLVEEINTGLRVYFDPPPDGSLYIHSESGKSTNMAELSAQELYSIIIKKGQPVVHIQVLASELAKRSKSDLLEIGKKEFSSGNNLIGRTVLLKIFAKRFGIIQIPPENSKKWMLEIEKLNQKQQ